MHSTQINYIAVSYQIKRSLTGHQISPYNTKYSSYSLVNLSLLSKLCPVL